MKAFLHTLLLVVASSLLISCGSEDSLTGLASSTTSTTTSSGTTTGAPVATLTLLASSPQINSGTGDQIDITAIVKDSNNVLLPEVDVSFTSTSGELQEVSTTTDSSGVASAILASSDPTNRTITVSATASTITANVNVVVIGSSISISGSNNLAAGDNVSLTLSLTDSTGAGVANTPVTITSTATSLTISNSSVTNSNGQLTIDFIATANDTITASALGTNTTFPFTVASTDSFSISSIADIPISTCGNVQAVWLQGGLPVTPAASVTFSSTRGTLYTDSGCSLTGDTVITDGTGTANIWMSSSTPGPFTITADASASGGPITSANGEFIATTPATLDLQALDATLSPEASTTLTAVVRDANANLVKGASVKFNIIQDATNGSISPGTSITDSLGRAQTVYTATVQSSNKDGIIIQATVDGTSISDTATLTVGQDALFVVLALATVVEDETPATYAYPGTIIVTDSAGNYVEGATVNLNIIPLSYGKGSRDYIIGDGLWIANWSIACVNEDLLTGDSLYDANGNIDPGEDINSNSTLESGNIASVDPEVTTDGSGLAQFYIRYPKDNASWTYAEISATAQTGGSEGRTKKEFILPLITADITTTNASDKEGVPGLDSPYGTSANCTIYP